MIDPKTIEVDGMEFYLQPLPALKAIKLDKRIVSLLVPALGGLKDISLNTNIDMETIAKGIAEALERMEDNDVEKLVVDLLDGAAYMEKGAAAQDMTANIINTLFRGKLVTLYKLMFEVMKYNKFSPFVLVGGGDAMKKIFTSLTQTKIEKENGEKLEASGNLLES